MNPTDWTATMDALTGSFVEANPLETATIKVGHRDLDVVLAHTPGQWARGFVGHPEIEAILFVMPPDSWFPFHMRGVDQDLIIAFYDSDGAIVDIGLLQANVGFKQPERPYTYALEIAGPFDAAIIEDLSRGIAV